MIFLFSIFAISAGLSHFPLSSKEEIKYVSKEESPLLALNKIDDFIGIIGREKISSSPEKQVDIYYLKNLKALKSDSALCSEGADLIFGPEKKVTLKRIKSELMASRSVTEICHLVMLDPGKPTEIKERHLFIKVLHAKVYAFVFRFSKTASMSEVQDAHRFIDDLR